MAISELEGGEGRVSISNSIAEIDFANGVLGGPFLTTQGVSQVTAVGQSGLYKRRYFENIGLGG